MKLNKIFAALLFLSFLSSPSIAAASSSSEQAAASGTYRKFVIYYGWYSDGEGRLGPDIDRIIRSQPEYVVSPYYTSAGSENLTPEVITKFRDSGITVLVYIATGNAGRDLDAVLAEIKTGLEAGAGGVMLDEVAMLHHQWEIDYYERIYEFVKSYGADRVVVANPGSIMVSENVMSVSDIVCFEHQWRLAPAVDWVSKYPPERLMGISSNDIAGVMGYGVDGETALRDTIEAWQSGIGYHYSTDTYTRLPSWFEEYRGGLEEFVVSGAKLGQVLVRTVDTAGDEIKGLWVEVRKNGRAVVTGFSPATFTLQEGTHQVIASNYQNYIFSKWQDGSLQPTYSVMVEEDRSIEVAAVYKNEQAEMHVESAVLSGGSIRGMDINVSRDGELVASGKTPFHAKLPFGIYSVTASSSKYYEFERWSPSPEGSPGSNVTTVDLTGDITATAYYRSSISASTLGDIGCNNNDYKEKVAQSMLRDGVLGGMLELHMRKSLAGIAC